MSATYTTLDELMALESLVVSTGVKPSKTAKGGGVYQTTHRGRGMDFSEVRGYQAGDEIRHMDWRVTARMGKPHVKLYQEERERPTLFMVDFSPSLYFGTKGAFKSVIAARLAAMMAWTAIKQGDKVGGVLLGGGQVVCYKPASRAGGVLPLLAKMSEFTTLSLKEQRPSVIQEGLCQLLHVTHSRSAIVLISDFYETEAYQDHWMKQLALHHEVFVYHLADPIELIVPPPGRYPMTFQGKNWVLDTKQPKARAAYEAFCIERKVKVSNWCHQLGLSYHVVSSEMNLQHCLYHHFLRRTVHG